MRPRAISTAASGAFVAQQSLDQFGLVAAVAQQRQMQGDAVEAIVQVFAEFAVRDHLADIAVRRADDVQIDWNRLIAAERHDFALLDHAQQPGLQHQRHVADFVEEQGAAAGLQDLARAGRPWMRR